MGRWPDPPVRFDGELLATLSWADQALGRLDGTASTLPNSDLFVAMYVRQQEAVLSSPIEGTQASLMDVLTFEADEEGPSDGDVEEVVNYVAALNHGLRRLQEFPLSLRLVREIHERLMRGVRGQERQPGEFRTTQNWIGGGGSTLATAAFVPPPPRVMQEALASLETFSARTGLTAPRSRGARTCAVRDHSLVSGWQKCCRTGSCQFCRLLVGVGHRTRLFRYPGAQRARNRRRVRSPLQLTVNDGLASKPE